MTRSIKSFDHLFFTVFLATLSPGFIFKCSMQNSSQWGVLHGKQRSKPYMPENVYFMPWDLNDSCFNIIFICFLRFFSSVFWDTSPFSIEILFLFFCILVSLYVSFRISSCPRRSGCTGAGGPRGAIPCSRSGGVAMRRYLSSKVRSGGCALLEQLCRDTPRPR